MKNKSKIEKIKVKTLKELFGVGSLQNPRLKKEVSAEVRSKFATDFALQLVENYYNSREKMVDVVAYTVNFALELVEFYRLKQDKQNYQFFFNQLVQNTNPDGIEIKSFYAVCVMFLHAAMRLQMRSKSTFEVDVTYVELLEVLGIRAYQLPLIPSRHEGIDRLREKFAEKTYPCKTTIGCNCRTMTKYERLMYCSVFEYMFASKRKLLDRHILQTTARFHGKDFHSIITDLLYTHLHEILTND